VITHVVSGHGAHRVEPVRALADKNTYALFPADTRVSFRYSSLWDNSSGFGGKRLKVELEKVLG
jgi:hypothetical protein